MAKRTRGEGTARTPRQPLTREKVLAGAMRLADEAGIEALTMRRLASTLGVEAMTLYHHVGNKDEMLDALVDRVTDEFAYAPEGAEWRDRIRTVAMSAYEALSRHRWAAGLSLSLRRPSPGRLRYMNDILDTLRSAGFSEELVDRGYHAIEGHIMGFTLWEVGMALPAPEDLARLATSFLDELDTDTYPRVAEHVQHHLRQRGTDEVGAFAFGLELILDGLERLRQAQ
jgi:AcrR family transcriptional regulator